MVLVIHVVIALLSLSQLTYTVVLPSDSSLRLSYGLVALTLATGTYLAVSRPGQLAHICMSGLVYSAAAIYSISLARRRLARATSIEQ